MKWVSLWCCLLFSSVFFFFRGPVRNDHHPHMQHLALMSPIYSAIQRVQHDFCLIFTRPFCDFAIALCHILLRSSTPSFPLCFPRITHFTIARIRRLWSCGQRRRACGAQQIRVGRLAVCMVVFSSVKLLWSVRCSQSNWFIVHIILLIRSFTRQISSESTLLGHRESRWEPSSPTSALYYS